MNHCTLAGSENLSVILYRTAPWIEHGAVRSVFRAALLKNPLRGDILSDMKYIRTRGRMRKSQKFGN